MLAMFLVEEWNKAFLGAKDENCIYHFCSHVDEERNTEAAILRGLLYQILEKRPHLAKCIQSFFETEQQTQYTKSSTHALWVCFKKCILDENQGKMFCVLDGLDLCSKAMLTNLIPRFADLCNTQDSRSGGPLRLLILSRDELNIQQCLRIRLGNGADWHVTEDIERFISARITMLSNKLALNEESIRSIRTRLREKSEGTFLWVGFAMNELLQKSTCLEISETLDSLPRGLSAIYCRVLLQIPPERRQIAFRILHFVVVAFQPLTLIELALATKIEPRSSLMGQNVQSSKEQAIQDYVTFCGSFLKVQKQKDHGIVVTLVHQSVKEYLMQGLSDCHQDLNPFCINVERTHFEMAQICIDYISGSPLSLETFDPSDDNDGVPGSSVSPELLVRSVDEWLQEYPFLRYATVYWPLHAKFSSEFAVDLLNRPDGFLERYSVTRANWCQLYTQQCFPKQYELSMLIGEKPKASPSQLLLIASRFAILPWVKKFLSPETNTGGEHNIEDQDEDGRTALSWAVTSGHEDVVQLLISNGAKINTEDKDGLTILGRALSRTLGVTPNLRIVQLLVSGGADLRFSPWPLDHALYWAVILEDEAILRYLLGRKAATDLLHLNGDSSLAHAAMVPEGTALVRLLLDHGANTNVRASHGLIRQVQEEIPLARKAANMLPGQFRGGTPLHSAVRSGSEATVRLLIDRGADLTAVDSEGCNMLHLACERGCFALVQLFLKCGLKTAYKDCSGQTPLHYAVCSAEQSTRVAKFLLDQGAVVDARNAIGQTPLHCIFQDYRSWFHPQRKETMQLLLDRGADVKARDSSQRSVLHYACTVVAGYEQDEGLLQSLLDFPNDINARDEFGETALHSAVNLSNSVAVNLLIQKGAEIEVRDDLGRTALHVASANIDVRYDIKEPSARIQDEPEFLLDQEANMEVRNNVRRQLISHKKDQEREDILRLLLKQRADVHAKDCIGWTPLHLAVEHGDRIRAMLIKSYGATW